MAQNSTELAEAIRKAREVSCLTVKKAVTDLTLWCGPFLRQFVMVVATMFVHEPFFRSLDGGQDDSRPCRERCDRPASKW